MFLFFLKIKSGKEECSNLRKIAIYKYFWLLQLVSMRFWTGQSVVILMLTEVVRVSFEVACPTVSLFFSDQIRQGGVLKLKKIGKCYVFSIVAVNFPKILGRSRCG